MAIDWNFIGGLEGGQSLTGYVPDPTGSMSGVTIATGVDLGQRSVDDINALNIPDALKVKLVPYAGLKGQDAANYLAQKPLTITQDEASALDQAVQTPLVNQLRSNYDAATSSGSFDGLPDQAQTVITSVATQYGPALSQATPTFWAKVTAKDWPGAVQELRNFGDSYPTRRNKEADLLQTIYQIVFGPVVPSYRSQSNEDVLTTGGSPMPASNTLVSLLIQFRWSLLFIVLLSLGHLPISPFSKSTGYGSYEQFVNNVVLPVVYTFLQVAPFLLLLSSLEALFGPSIRWIWNRRLADRIQFLQRRGMHTQARQLADRRLSSTRWTAIVFTILALTAVLVSVGYYLLKPRPLAV